VGEIGDKMDKDEFVDLITDFVDDNYTIENVGEDAYIERDDYRGSYDIAIEELAKKLGLWRVLFEIKK